MRTGVNIKKVDKKLVITIECNHEIVDDCFLFGSVNAPSEAKSLIMEVSGEAIEDYIRDLDHPDKRNKEYFDNEFSMVKITNSINRNVSKERKCYCGQPVDTTNADCDYFNLCKDHAADS